MKTQRTLRDNQQTPAPPSFWRLAHDHARMSEGQRIQSIMTGLSVSWATAAKLTFGMSSTSIGRLLNLSLSTYERRKKDEKPLDSVASERLDRLASIAILAEDVFEDKQKAARWLAAPNDALGGNSPVMQCETEIGAKQVRRVLNALEWGGVV
ncbi:MAG: type II RES/Xre toxin-antitoxin system antitoxin [Advenella sp.]|nr:antitoxin Xre/MbcA/ParS toxin-binding domain-containing protein [Advenella sp. FME57]